MVDKLFNGHVNFKIQEEAILELHQQMRVCPGVMD